MAGLLVGVSDNAEQQWPQPNGRRRSSSCCGSRAVRADILTGLDLASRPELQRLEALER